MMVQAFWQPYFAKGQLQVNLLSCHRQLPSTRLIATNLICIWNFCGWLSFLKVCKKYGASHNASGNEQMSGGMQSSMKCSPRKALRNKVSPKRFDATLFSERWKALRATIKPTSTYAHSAVIHCCKSLRRDSVRSFCAGAGATHSEATRLRLTVNTAG